MALPKFHLTSEEFTNMCVGVGGAKNWTSIEQALMKIKKVPEN